jgi:hypothetical protein
VDVHVCDEVQENRPVITIQVTSKGPDVGEAEERNSCKAAGAVAEAVALS